MPSQIEKIAEYFHGDKMFRTNCKCCGDDPLTFTVATDDEYPEVYLEVYMKISSQFVCFDEPRWSRPFRNFWRRLTSAFTLLFKGYHETQGSFIFRGEEHIDEFCETIQVHKRYAIKKHEEDKLKRLKDKITEENKHEEIKL